VGTRWWSASRDAASGDLFGGKVAITGDIVVVGALSDDDAGTLFENAGAAYIFERVYAVAPGLVRALSGGPRRA